MNIAELKRELFMVELQNSKLKSLLPLPRRSCVGNQAAPPAQTSPTLAPQAKGTLGKQDVLELPKIFLSLTFIASITLTGRAEADSWDSANHPAHLLGRNFEQRIGQLPWSGRVTEEDTPYSDTYWPRNRGSIAYRWNSSDPIFRWQDPHRRADPRVFQIHSPSRTQALSLTRQELAELSPAEKFDLVQGHYDYPLTRRVLGNSSLTAEYWEGMCHGWAPASLNHREPAPTDVVNPDGIVVPFGAGDVKGLLNYYYGNYRMQARQVGRRCKRDVESNGSAGGSAACRDVNPGTFHLVLTNLLGLQRRGFVAETERGREVWNYPVYQYSSTYHQVSLPSRTCGGWWLWAVRTHCKTENAVQRIRVTTTIHYADDNEAFGPEWNPVVGTPNFRHESSTYSYDLDLGLGREILGGEWNQVERPDFLWIKDRMDFSGEFEILDRIYRPAQNPSSPH
jgi:hypothetical protein